MPAGKLLIVEYSTPQASADADGKFQPALAGQSCDRLSQDRELRGVVFDVTDSRGGERLTGSGPLRKRNSMARRGPGETQKMGRFDPPNGERAGVEYLLACCRAR